MTQQQPTPSLARDGLLAGTLVTLADTPDDNSGVEDLLIMVAQLAAQRVAAVSYASVTARREGAYTTVAASNDIALAVDQAQYADHAGPCLEAVETGKPLSVPIAALNLYGHDSITMAALTAAVWASYNDTAPINLDVADLDPGGTELVEGLTNAFTVRATIQQAMGIVIAKQNSTPDRAYAALRLRAAEAEAPLLDIAETIIANESS